MMDFAQESIPGQLDAIRSRLDALDGHYLDMQQRLNQGMEERAVFSATLNAMDMRTRQVERALAENTVLTRMTAGSVQESVKKVEEAAQRMAESAELLQAIKDGRTWWKITGKIAGWGSGLVLGGAALIAALDHLWTKYFSGGGP